MVQAHIFFSGIVQGVGFRYTVCRLAEDIGELGGWVKNLPDGRVEAVVEGRREAIAQLLGALERHFDGYLKEKDVQYSEPSGEFRDFQITH